MLNPVIRLLTSMCYLDPSSKIGLKGVCIFGSIKQILRPTAYTLTGHYGSVAYEYTQSREGQHTLSKVVKLSYSTF